MAPPYQHFYIEPAVWVQWDDTRRNQHFEAFLRFVPSSLSDFQKPKAAGKKSCDTRKRTRMPEPELFKERINRTDTNMEDEGETQDGLHIRIRRTSSSYDDWEVCTIQFGFHRIRFFLPIRFVPGHFVKVSTLSGKVEEFVKGSRKVREIRDFVEKFPIKIVWPPCLI